MSAGARARLLVAALAPAIVLLSTAASAGVRTAQAPPPGEITFSASGDIVAVLPARQLKLGMRVAESGQVAVGEVLARSQSACEIHQR